jgi:HD-GYP domain-containing protein (c-di-GMP phosphodiesterase class II)
VVGPVVDARIILVVDAFDAITSDRPYRRGRSVIEAPGELHLNVRTHFSPRVVAALKQVYVERPHLLGAGRPRALERVAWKPGCLLRLGRDRLA